MKKLKIQSENHMTFEEGFKEFLDSCKARNLRPATIIHYEEGYKAITKFIKEDTQIQDITHTTIDCFVRYCKDRQTINSQTLYTYVRNFKTILYYFMRMNYMNTFKICLPKVEKTIIEGYTDAELKILLKKPDIKKCTFVEYRDWTVINFLLSTGMRLSSFINIKIKDLDFENEVVYVNVTKNRKPLIIPLNKTIINILKEYLKFRQYKDLDNYLFCTVFGKILDKRTITGSLAKFNRERGVITTGIHRYRHTFAKKFILNGGNITSLSKILGHSSILVTENYINIMLSDLKKDMDDFNILKEFNDSYIKLSNKKK